MNRRKKERKAKQKRKRIDAYRRSGKTLAPPLAVYTNLKPLDYHRHLMPQLLWLESVLDCYGEKRFPGMVHRFLDSVDTLGTTAPTSGL